ncbi:hypothetical protein ACP70R_008053 [Stipagrostis hirtigluma subsp. patula]
MQDRTGRDTRPGHNKTHSWSKPPKLIYGGWITKASSEWVLDTFAWMHHTSNPRLLLRQGKLSVESHEWGRGGVLRTHGGSIRTESFSVPDVRYVEGDARNVISVHQLAVDHGLVTVFEPTSCYVKDNKTGQVVGKGRLRNGTYVLDYLRIDQGRGGGGDDGKRQAEGRDRSEENSDGSGEGESRGGDGNQDRGGGEGGDGGRGGAEGGGGGDRGRGRGRGGGGDGDKGEGGGGDGDIRDKDGGGGVGGNRDRGAKGGGDCERGGGGDNHSQDRVGSGGRDGGGGGGMEANKDDDEKKETDMFGLKKFSKYINTASYRILSSQLPGGGGGAGKKGRFSGRGIEGAIEEGGEAQEEGLEESYKVHSDLFGLSRFDVNEPLYFRRGAFPTWANEPRENDFLLDSGACFHVTWNESVLFPYPYHLHRHTRPPISSLGGIFKSADGAGSIDIIGSGYLNGKIMLDGVLLAPDSTMNLVSVGQLTCQYGVAVEFGPSSFIIKRLMDGVKVGSGYMRSWGHHYVVEHFRPELLYAHSGTCPRNIFGNAFAWQQLQLRYYHRSKL